ncbi:hypothetical protein CEXT_176321, partial [Caerostris extrusa]
GVINTINFSEIWIKRMSDGNRIRIQLTHLQKGSITLRRRAA